jgi:hypothetical protein
MEIAVSIEQVGRVLADDGLDFQTREDGGSYQIQAGSAAVFIDFKATRDHRVVVTVYSAVLQEIDGRAAGSVEGLGLLNTLNRSYDFVKFSLAEDSLFVEYDLLGDTLHPDELRNAISTVAQVSDHLDDHLLAHFGGKRFVTALSDWTRAVEGEASGG